MNVSNRMRDGRSRCRQHGLSLLELLVAMAFTAILLLGLVQFAAAAGMSRQLQDSQAQLQDQARSVFRMLGGAVGEAGFHPRPWNPAYPLEGVFSGSASNVSIHGDRLVVRTWSDRNCFGNLNAVREADGRPAFHLRESAYDLNDAGQLTRSCRYGPTAAELTTQVRRQGKVPGVDGFRLLFGIDSDRDGNAERWVRAGDWSDSRHVLGVRVGLLLRSADPVADPVATQYSVLDRVYNPPADGHLRLVLEFTAAIRGRTG